MKPFSGDAVEDELNRYPSMFHEHHCALHGRFSGRRESDLHRLEEIVALPAAAGTGRAVGQKR